MTNFLSSWVISIIGIIFVGLLSDIIMPNGKMQNVVKTTVSIFIILTILKPINNIDINNLNFFNFNSNTITADTSIIEKYDNLKIEKLKTDIEKLLNENGFYDVNISFELSENNKISTIYVDLSSLVLIDKTMNINKYTNIVAIIKQFVNVDREHIVFYEWRQKY